MTAPASQPNWDMTPYFSALDAPDYATFRDALKTEVQALRERAEGLGALDAETKGAWATLLVALEDVTARFEHLSSYLLCLGAADSRDEAIQRQVSALSPLQAEVEKIFVAIKAAFKRASDADFDALVADETLTPVRYFVQRIRQQAARTMPAELEGLTADLAVDGIDAWGRLYGQVSGKLEFTLAVAGRPPQTLPVSMTRTLLEDSDPAVRLAAQRGSNQAWERASDSVAAALNGIAGTRLTLYARRGIDHFLEPALFDAGIERATLDAMLDAVRARQEVGRRYLRAKARKLGVERLGFQDAMAPLPSDDEARIDWDTAVARVNDAFGGFYPALSEFADRAVTRRWIDYDPRPGKRPGGFCTSSSLNQESRIFLTFNGADGDVRTLAHELGHAFHNWVMRDMRPWARVYPMTLAETASTFAEEVIADAALADPALTDAQRLVLLDQRLNAAPAFLLNIPTRFDFEYAVYERRADGELTVSELKELMLDAQRRNYGDALAPDQLDPWFWASKLHFYITEISFYNFPYTFGYLFSLGIFARAKAEGPAFLPRYEALLRATGSAPVEEVVRSALGVDLSRPAFWNESIDLIERLVEQYETL